MNKIVERNQATDALRESEIRKGAILESLLDCIISIDHEGKIIEFNPAAETTFGYTRAKVIGKELAETIVPPSLREAHRRGFARYLATGEGPILGKRIQITAMRADGSEFPTELAIVPIYLGEQPIFTAYLRDITEHKRAEEKLKDGERRLAEAQQLAHLGSWEWDIPTNTVVWSDELYRIYGMRQQDFSASYEGFLECVHPDDRERVKKIIEDSYLHKKPLDYYHRIVRPDGTVRTLHARGGVVVDDAGNPIRMLGTGLDVTELQQAEEEIRKLNAELELRVQERTAELQATLHQLTETQNQLILQEKMVAIGKLTAGIAHEINSPIGAIKSNMDIANRCLSKLQRISLSDGVIRKNSEYQKYLKILKEISEVSTKASDRISSIISSLKKFTRLDEATFDKVKIHEGLDSALTLIQHEINDGIDVVKEYGEIPEIYCFVSELNQVFMTLLRNAAQAIEQQGQITIETWVDNRRVCVRISDTGKGMPEENVKSIFDFSFTTKDSRIGLGMGLINAYNIIQKHSGEIEVESEVDKGSTFTIILPTDLKKTDSSKTLAEMFD